MNFHYTRRRIRFYPSRLFFPIFVLLAALLLSGCVRYDVGVNFEGQYRGEIVQRIQLAEQLTSFSQAETDRWLGTFEGRARQLQGQAKRLSEREVLVTIPFGNGKELVEKFNQFFNSDLRDSYLAAQTHDLDFVQPKSEMALHQSNFLLAERDRLSLTVDLRGLGVLSNQGTLIVSPESLAKLDFSLNAPWGAKSLVGEDGDGVYPPANREGGQLVWQLQPGQVNHLEAVFWMPSYLAFGIIAIALLVVAGFYIKYKQFPWDASDLSTDMEQ